MNTSEALPFVKIIADEGMPSLGNPFVKGNLYIMFRVRFPNDNDLTSNQIEALKSILPDPDRTMEYDKDEVEEVHMTLADLRQFGKGGATDRGDTAYDSDEEQEGGPGNVQCQQS